MSCPIIMGEHDMTNLYLNGEEMVWITVDENCDGDLEVFYSPKFQDHLLTLSQAKHCVSTNTIPENYWEF